MSNKFQMTLNNALNYWLYRSFSGQTLRKRFYSSRLISTNYLQDLANEIGGSPVQNTVPIRRYAEILADIYKYWQNNIPHSGAVSTIPRAVTYEEWLDNGGKGERYLPVHIMKELFLREKCKKLFSRAIIHGSVATLDDSPGFSDMDLAYVVKASVLTDPIKLLELRNLASEILSLTYSFDPFMHHGPYYLSEIDLTWYPEAMFPTVLFGYGVDLLDDSKEIRAYIRPSEDITEQMMNMFEEFFTNWPCNPFVLKDSYELEWVLGSVMLLPALYLQGVTGEFRYKRDAFDSAEKDFSFDEWEPVKAATYVRSNLKARPKMSSKLVRLAMFFRWPGLVQSVARRKKESIERAQEAGKILGPDYPLRVLRLLRAMKKQMVNN
jgi:hypothetical protein